MTPRETMHDAILECRDRHIPDGAVCVGFMVITEWVLPEGHVALTKMSGNASGEGLPTWREKGYAADIVFAPVSFSLSAEDPWAQTDDEDNEDDGA